MNAGIAIVGMACEYPDASTPQALWENVLARRRSFRRMPSERLRLEDYYSPDPAQPDTTYAVKAALIEGYAFDRVSFRVAGSTFRSVDMAHWLALDVAARALADTGFPQAKGLPRERTGVLVGNTLTGEFSRAGVMRLRWPYVRRVVEQALAREGWTTGRREEFLRELESAYKRPFPPVTEETLAGGLSNTIAGRICNFFDLRGGGYTVDGACSSSLLAVANACAALESGQLDVALAGGVDLSLDPFELVGFAKTGALAKTEMRVYDVRSNGFWPGEGCGFVVLMRLADAQAMQLPVYAVIRGWGISSDGSGGLTRPEVEGQLAAIRRAYERAGYGIDTVGYFEGHGTGTAVGDAVELRTLSQARQEANRNAPPAVIGSVKANIGHTKAAAGAAGLIKAVMALQRQIIPPTTGCLEPHPVLTESRPALRVLQQGERWPAGVPLRAAVSSMGFGGINVHLTLEGIPARRRARLSREEIALMRSPQDAELLLLAGDSREELLRQVERLAGIAERLSLSELTDLACHLQRERKDGRVRAAIVAAQPEELKRRLALLCTWLHAGETARMDAAEGVFLGTSDRALRIGFLFPGQGTLGKWDGGMWRSKFPQAADLLRGQDEQVPLAERVDTRSAQSAIIRASLAGLRLLRELGVEAVAAAGHSLGELTALHWAGALDEQALIRLAEARGQAMGGVPGPEGAMLGIQASTEEAQQLLAGTAAVIAAVNGSRQVVISGERAAVEAVAERARIQGVAAVPLSVSHAFHSPLMAPAVPVLARYLTGQSWGRLRKRVVSTVTGEALSPDEPLADLLLRQLTAPVLFDQAVERLRGEVDLLIEVGPGEVLAGLVRRMLPTPVVSLDVGGPSLKGLLLAAAAAYAGGGNLDFGLLFADRFARPFSPDRPLTFLRNPCEDAPLLDGGNQDVSALPDELAADGKGTEMRGASADSEGKGSGQPDAAGMREETESLAAAGCEAPGNGAGGTPDDATATGEQVLEVVRQMVAERTELPLEAVQPDHRLLDDLHLNSLAVGQLVVKAARALQLAPPVAPAEYANATVREVAEALMAASAGSPGSGEAEEAEPAGLDAWIATFAVEWEPRPLAGRRGAARGRTRSAPSATLAARKAEATGGDGPATQRRGGWRVIAPKGHPLASALRSRLRQRVSGSGTVVCLPPEPDERHLGLLLEGAESVRRQGDGAAFVLVQHGWGAVSFAKTLYLERNQGPVVVADVPLHPHVADWVLDEIEAADGFVEVRYDEAGVRSQPLLRRCFPDGTLGAVTLDDGDVLLVTGGGKGIAAECARALAKQTGVRLVLIGRSRPEEDAELSAHLNRLRLEGIAFHYFSADVTDAAAVRKAVRDIEASLGPVTAILHAAGSNAPALLPDLDEAAFRRTLAPKVRGAQHLLAAVNPARLKLFVAFGSVIGQTGMRGEAHYALANEWLRQTVEELARNHPSCRALCIDWSVWSGIGMGERLGRVETLRREGIAPIPPDEGIRLFLELLAQPRRPRTVVVTGRFGRVPTLRLPESELPLCRFVENVRVHYPGVELVADAVLSVHTDPYLKDHAFGGQLLFPAVMGIEAMVQTAMAMADTRRLPVLEAVRFERPIVVPEDGKLTIRLLAQVREPEVVEVAIRSEETGFSVDHFRAVCRFGRKGRGRKRRLPEAALADVAVPGDPLYGELLFQSGRFRRLIGYGHLSAKSCAAVVEAKPEEAWFGPFLPAGLTAGDPGARDGILHAVQACVPHKRLLPVGADRVVPGAVDASGRRVAKARERTNDGKVYVYDIEVTAADGQLVERWEGVRFQMVEGPTGRKAWLPALLGPYVERRAEELFALTGLAVSVGSHAGRGRRGRSGKVVQQALGEPLAVWKRSDGKPEAAGGWHVSAAHSGPLTMGAVSTVPVGCDLECVQSQPAEIWRDLLGPERFSLALVLAARMNETLDGASTRVWGAVESLKKAGAPSDTPILLEATVPDEGWALLSAGRHRIATLIAAVSGLDRPVALAVLKEAAR